MIEKVAQKILVADDDENIRFLCSETLSAAGYNVMTAVNGIDALGRLNEQDFGLVIADTEMPELDGMGLYSNAIRNQPGLKDSFLFLTEDHSHCMRSDFDRYDMKCLDKPFKVTDLLEQVDSIMSNHLEGFYRRNIGGKRQEKRFGVSANCGVFGKDDHGQKIIVAKAQDVSRNGIRIRHAGEPLKSISQISVLLSINYLNLLRDARVVWSKEVAEGESMAGLSLLEPIPASSIISVMPGSASQLV